MSRFEKLLWLFPKGHFFEKLRTEKTKTAFLQEINFINFQRLRTMTVVAFIVTIIMLVLDFKTEKIWNQQTLDRFAFIDIILLIVLLFPLYVCFFHAVRDKADIKSLHIAATNTTIFSFAIWGTSVSVNEWETANGMPTFLIVVFVICTVFIHRGPLILITLIACLSALIGLLLIRNIDFIKLIQHYVSSIFFVVIAYIISRILLVYSVKAFSAKTDLENTNTHLDELVKARTKELTVANERLMIEIAERGKYEIQLQKEKERAEESDRLKSAFLANMSHEIRTPLNGIVGFSDLMQSLNLDEAKRQRYATIIKNNSYQLLKIIDDIIDISMIESNQLKLKFSTTTVKQIIESSIEFYTALPQPNNAKQIQFESINLIPNSDVELYTDAMRVQQVIFNLLNNAIKFTEKGKIKLITRLDDDEVLFCVEDTGIGISADKSEIIFERFVQVGESSSKATRGTGLGLSISAGIVQSLNGKIWLDYSYSGGSRFCFTIPLKRPLRKIAAPEKLKIDEKLTLNKKILIKSDTKSQFNFLKNLFKSGEISQNTNSENNYDIIIDTLIPTLIKPVPDNNKKNGNQALFLILQNDQELKKAITMGFNRCYLDPINISKLVKDLNTELTSKALKS